MNISQISNYKNKISNNAYITNTITNNICYKDFLPQPDIFYLNFTGIEHSQTEPVHLDNAMKLSGIHCPVCGIKMLSKNDFNSLVDNIKNINNSGQILTILEDYKDNLPIIYKRIINDSKRIPDYRNIGVKDYINALLEIAEKEKVYAIRVFKHEATEYMPNIPEENFEEYMNFVNSVNKNDSFQIIGEKIENLINLTNINKTHINNIKTGTLYDIRQLEKYIKILNIENLEELNDTQAAKQLIYNIFYPSLNHMQKIEKYDYYYNNPNNNIITCGACNAGKYPNVKVFFKDRTKPNLKENIILYLKDISFLNGVKTINIPDNYISYVCSRVNSLSGHTINFDKREIQKIYNAQNIMSRHETFIPIIQSEVDIPCAECGSTMIPHIIKLRIIDDLSKCKTPYDYSQVLQKYSKYEGPYSRKLIEIFTGINEKNPYISNEKFLELYKKSTDNYLKRGIYQILSDYKSTRPYYSAQKRNKLSMFDLIYYRSKMYIDEGFFDDYDINNFLQTVFERIDQSDTSIKSVANFLRQLKIISYKHSLASPYSGYEQDARTTLNCITYNLLMSDLATADHFVAFNKGGNGSKYNLIGLCKGCNKLKSKKNVMAWYTQHPGVKRNLPNQIEIIDEMAKNGILDGYEDWASEIAEKLYFETKELVDLREKFKPE